MTSGLGVILLPVTVEGLVTQATQLVANKRWRCLHQLLALINVGLLYLWCRWERPSEMLYKPVHSLKWFITSDSFHCDRRCMFTIGSTRAFYTGDPLLYTFYMGGKHGHASNSEQYSVNTERHDARETTLQSLGNRSTNTIAAICLVSRPCLVDNMCGYTLLHWRGTDSCCDH